MQDRARLRILTLWAVLAAASALVLLARSQPGPPPGRWPPDGMSYEIPGWHAGEAQELGPQLMSRRYVRSEGPSMEAELTILASGQAKHVYAAHIETPFWGAGYEVSGVPLRTRLVGGATAARNAWESWHVVYAYGERRGMLGNGPEAWALSFGDAVLGRANSYYRLALTAAHDEEGGPVAREGLEALANLLFPRIADWYRESGAP